MSKQHEAPEDLPTSAGVTSAGEGIENATPQMPTGKVGRYTITRIIGEGVMGAVYEAEHDQPRRTVALKVNKPGLASPELLRGFALDEFSRGRLWRSKEVRGGGGDPPTIAETPASSSGTGATS